MTSNFTCYHPPFISFISIMEFLPIFFVDLDSHFGVSFGSLLALGDCFVVPPFFVGLCGTCKMLELLGTSWVWNYCLVCLSYVFGVVLVVIGLSSGIMALVLGFIYFYRRWASVVFVKYQFLDFGRWVGWINYGCFVSQEVYHGWSYRCWRNLFGVPLIFGVHDVFHFGQGGWDITYFFAGS